MGSRWDVSDDLVPEAEGVMIDERLTPENIISRCLADFVRRGGLTEADVDDSAKAVLESLKLFGFALVQGERQ